MRLEHCHQHPQCGHQFNIMVVNGNINFTGTISKSGTVLKQVYVDDYKHGLTLSRGYIGGGYVSSSVWNTVTKIANATDAWSTASNALPYATKYGTWSSSATNGYCGNANRDTATGMQKFNFAAETTATCASKNYGGANPWSVQEGVGFNTDGTAYGTKAYHGGYANGGYWDRWVFATETAAALSSGSAPDTQETCGWFDKYYSWVNYGATTLKMTTSSESWATLSTTNTYSGVGGYGSPGYWYKPVNTKDGKCFMCGDQSYVGTTTGLNCAKFLNSTSTWIGILYKQTLANSEQSGVMGQNHGYFAGGYSGVQNAHSDRIDYGSETIRQIFDAPRALSSGAPMWSGAGTILLS